MKDTTAFLTVPEALPADEVLTRCLTQAVRFRASDLFFQSNENHVVVSMRHLGLLRLMSVLPLEQGRRCISHIKATAGIDVAEKRRPLDGRWVRDLGDRTVDVRISTIPTLHGEDVTLRILDRDFGLMSLEDLGLLRRTLNQLLAILQSPSGLILVTGPTGSGKTTTLYGCLRHLHNGTRKINTIEDPVEYSIDGVRQSQVNPTLEVGFPELLQAVLRQSPDIIMIGEIRDPLTAETAVRAANSGHLVLATLHAPISAGAVQSMLSLGVHPHFLSSSLRGVIAQRLVRTLCPSCRVAFNLTAAPQTFDEIKKWLEPGQGQTLYTAKGCDQCLQTGYAGRSGFFEILDVSPAIREMILQRCPAQQIHAKAAEEGLIEIRHAAMLKVAHGETTVEEVLRVVPIEFLGL